MIPELMRVPLDYCKEVLDSVHTVFIVRQLIRNLMMGTRDLSFHLL